MTKAKAKRLLKAKGVRISTIEMYGKICLLIEPKGGTNETRVRVRKGKR